MSVVCNRDLVCIIMKFLSASDRCRVRRVSKTWLSAFKNALKLYHFDLSNSSVVDVGMFAGIVSINLNHTDVSNVNPLIGAKVVSICNTKVTDSTMLASCKVNHHCENCIDNYFEDLYGIKNYFIPYNTKYFPEKIYYKYLGDIYNI